MDTCRLATARIPNPCLADSARKLSRQEHDSI